MKLSDNGERSRRAVVSSNIRKFRKARNLSQAELAKLIGVSKSAIAMYEKGERFPKDYIYQELVKVLNVPDLYLPKNPDVKKKQPERHISHENIPKVIKNISTINNAVANISLEDLKNDPICLSVKNKYKNDFCITIQGNSMINAGIRDGDIVFVQKMPSVQNGQIALVVIDGEEFYLRRFYKEYDKIILVAENPDYPPILIDKACNKTLKVLGLAVIKQTTIK